METTSERNVGTIDAHNGSGVRYMYRLFDSARGYPVMSQNNRSNLYYESTVNNPGSLKGGRVDDFRHDSAEE